MVDDVGHVVDELDDELGEVVARRGLGGEDVGAREEAGLRVGLQLEVLVDDVHDVEELALVLVHALDLDVEERIDVDLDIQFALDEFGQADLVLALHGHDALLEPAVVGEGLQLFELAQVGDPAGADLIGDEAGQAGVRLQQPAAGGDAVGLVVELAGPQLVEVLEERGLEQLGMEGGDAVDGVGADDGEVGHADLAGGGFLDERHAGDAVLVAGEARGDLAQEAAVDLEDDLEVAGQDAFEEADGPAFEGLGHEGVVGVAEGAGDDGPGVVPLEALVVEEDAHELGDGEGGMGVVELDGDLVGEGVDFVAVGLEAADDVVQGAGDEEVLLLEAQFAALLDVVVGIEDFGDVLGERLGLVGLHVVAVVEEGEVEILGGLGLPQAQVVDGAVAEAGDGVVVGDAEDGFVVGPAGEEAAVDLLHEDAAAEVDLEARLGALDLPGVAEAEPVVGFLDLVAVLDGLAEDAVVVADAVAVAGELEGGEGIEEAGGEAAEAAVAEAGVAFEVAQDVPGEAEVGHGLLDAFIHLEVDDIVAHGAADEVLHGEVVGALGAGLVVGDGGADPAVDEAVADGEGEGVVAVVVGGGKLVLGEGIFQVVEIAALEGFGGLQLLAVAGRGGGGGRIRFGIHGCGSSLKGDGPHGGGKPFRAW